MKRILISDHIRKQKLSAGEPVENKHEVLISVTVWIISWASCTERQWEQVGFSLEGQAGSQPRSLVLTVSPSVSPHSVALVSAPLGEQLDLQVFPPSLETMFVKPAIKCE